MLFRSLKFDTGTKHPADGSQHEYLQALGIEQTFFRTQEVVQGVLDTGLSIPAKGLQILQYGMESVFIRDNADGVPQRFFLIEMVVAFKVELKITHIPLGDGAAGALPAYITDDAVPLGQHIEAYGSPQCFIVLQNKNAVVNGLQNIVLAVLFKPLKNLLLRHRCGFVRQSLDRKSVV